MKLKKSFCIISIFIFLIFISFMLFYDNKEDVVNNDLEPKKSNPNAFAIMLETEAGSGSYEPSSSSLWPGDGYIFNETLSRCENGGELTWHEDTRTVSLKASGSDKCYLYFDIQPPTLVEYIINHEYIEDGVNGLYYHDGQGNYINANLEAQDNSYRYSGSNYNLTESVNTYEDVYALSTSNSLIKKYCDSDDSIELLIDFCYSDSYYYIADNKNELFQTVYEAEIKALQLGYIDNNVKNYVCFGSDEKPCPFNNLYRIIGLFKNNQGEYQIKLIKKDNISNSIWSGDLYLESNDWSESLLNKEVLNIDFINDYIGGSTSKWYKMIVENSWIISGNSSANIVDVNVKQAFNNEIINPLNNDKYNAKIALPYVTDIGYAASSYYWSENLKNSYYNILSNDNWMVNVNGINTSLLIWSITKDTDTINNVYGSYSGIIGSTSIRSAPSYGDYPTFYLDSSVYIVDGDGSINNPYIIGM